MRWSSEQLPAAATRRRSAHQPSWTRSTTARSAEVHVQARVERHHERVDGVLDVEPGRRVAQQHGEVRAVGGVRPASVARAGFAVVSSICGLAVVEQRDAPRPNACSRSRTGAPGPSGGAPRSSRSCSSWWRSPSSANVSPARSPKRRSPCRSRRRPPRDVLHRDALGSALGEQLVAAPRIRRGWRRRRRARSARRQLDQREILHGAAHHAASASAAASSARAPRRSGALAASSPSAARRAGSSSAPSGAPRRRRAPVRPAVALEHLSRRSSPAPCAPPPAPRPHRTARCWRPPPRRACRAAGSSHADAKPSRARF